MVRRTLHNHRLLNQPLEVGNTQPVKPNTKRASDVRTRRISDLQSDAVVQFGPWKGSQRRNPSPPANSTYWEPRQNTTGYLGGKRACFWVQKLSPLARTRGLGEINKAGMGHAAEPFKKKESQEEDQNITKEEGESISKKTPPNYLLQPRPSCCPLH